MTHQRKRHQDWMQIALEQARLAAAQGEVPVGAVLVDAQDNLIAASGNRREQDWDPTAHAEMIVLRWGGAKRRNWHFLDCRLYVTLEPCPMCAAAICQARVGEVIYGADDPKAGALGSVLNLPSSPACFHRPRILAGIEELACQEIITRWFQQYR